MKVYIAGKLCSDQEKEFLEEIDRKIAYIGTYIENTHHIMDSFQGYVELTGGRVKMPIESS